MAVVFSSMSVSLDGFVAAPDGSLDWAPQDPDVFASSVAEVGELGAYLLGRRLYETMLFWEDVDDASLDPAQLTWKRLWRALPKVVFSSSLTEVVGSARLAEEDLAAELARLRSEVGDKDVCIGGPGLIAQADAAGLLDEHRLRVCPVVLGGGAPYFTALGGRTDLELLAVRTFASGIVSLRYRVLSI